jgi:pimeloyl-ACP methyl ester carboxylesterase
VPKNGQAPIPSKELCKLGVLGRVLFQGRKLLGTLAVLMLLTGVGQAQSVDFKGRAKEVLPSTRDDSTIPPVLFSGPEGEVVIANQAILRLLEEKHSIFLDEASDLAVFELDLVGCQIEEREWGGRQFRTLLSVDRLRTSPDDSFQEFAILDPGKPKADELHRYLEVPCSWDKPELGTFQLYYELNSDFDPSLPTVMVPCDPQRSRSWVGEADRQKRIMRIEDNVVTFDYRGTFASEIPSLRGPDGIDWLKSYHMLHPGNAVHDMDAIRKDLLGEDGRWNLVGGSGIAIMSLMYLSEYHRYVDRAFLMGLYHEAASGCRAVDDFFSEFLTSNQIERAFAEALRRPEIDRRQLYYLLQRLLYSDQGRAQQLLTQVAGGDLAVYREETAKHGRVDYFIRSTQRYWPQIVVFMYLTNVSSETYPDGGINAPFLEMGRPIAELVSEGRLPRGFMNISGLEQVESEVLLVAGTLDQVCPLPLMEAIHQQLPNSDLLEIGGYHCLPRQGELRGRLLNTFLHHGAHSEAMHDLLEVIEPEPPVLELRD